jgi:heme-degrading monooxygenase HmoA/ketosteroid isomerase-like protein
MVVTVFRSRLKPEAKEEYARWAGRMEELVRQVPGYVSHKGFVAEDGERVTIVEFASEEGQRAWATHPEHVEVQKKGRQDFYAEFRVQVCTVQREMVHPATGARDMDILQRLNESYIRSVRTSDARWFEEHLAEDFVNSNPDGSLVDRAGFLAQVTRPMTLSNFRVEDVAIRILGDTAIIHGKTIYRKADGQPATGRYTDVWARRKGRWLCVAAHVTRG